MLRISTHSTIGTIAKFCPYFKRLKKESTNNINEFSTGY